MSKKSRDATQINTVNQLAVALRKGTKKYAILLTICVIFVLGLLIFLDSTLQDVLPILIIIATIIFVIGITVIIFVIHRDTLSETLVRIDNVVKQSISETLACQDCVAEMFEIQKRLYSTELEDLVHSFSADEIRKVNLLVRALAQNDSSISEDEVNKVGKFIERLIDVKESNKPASYITMDDMSSIESRVNDYGTINIVSSSISCDDDLKDAIIGNLKRGVQYNYYFPRNNTNNNDNDFQGLLDQFNKNINFWCSDPSIDNQVIRQQVKCYWFPEEYMQMSMTFYDYQLIFSGKSPSIIVKFPATNADVIQSFPLFFFVDSDSSMNQSICKIFRTISNHSTECAIEEINRNGRLAFSKRSPSQANNSPLKKEQVQREANGNSSQSDSNSKNKEELQRKHKEGSLLSIHIGDNNQAKYAGIMGSSAGGDMTVDMNVNDQKEADNLNDDQIKQLLSELTLVRKVLAQNDDDESGIAIGNIASASKMLKENCFDKAITFLKQSGKLILSIAEKVGCPLLLEYLKNKIGK